MNTGEVLWLVLMGFVFVWACDLFGLWQLWTRNINEWWERRQRGGQ